MSNDNDMEVTITLTIKFPSKQEWYGDEVSLDSIAKLEALNFINYPIDILNLENTRIINLIAEINEKRKKDGENRRAVYRLSKDTTG